MKFEEMVMKDLVFLGGEFETNVEVIEFLSSQLEKVGFVKDGFCDAVIEREKQFPTGLDLGKINVAIPHTDMKYVNKSGIAVATVKRPVLFGKMDEPSVLIPVHIVFLLTVLNPGEYVKFLSRLTQSFSDQTFVSLIYSLKDTEEFVKALKKVIMTPQKE